MQYLEKQGEQEQQDQSELYQQIELQKDFEQQEDQNGQELQIKQLQQEVEEQNNQEKQQDFQEQQSNLFENIKDGIAAGGIVGGAGAMIAQSSITIIKNVMGLVQNAILAVAYLAMGIDCYMMKMIVLLQQTQFLMTFSQPMQEVGQRNYLLYTIIQISFKASRTT
ncbi:unnamed protein product [Paramecium octaurelia]|uniref:Uncharacterized protein n=1 Tax=Paramecium octaurelia TaxID=43137 RepID=A0A8S1UJJ7_PAROT|nr:unnamed protein product [Paramecium octaurelia]